LTDLAESEKPRKTNIDDFTTKKKMCIAFWMHTFRQVQATVTLLINKKLSSQHQPLILSVRVAIIRMEEPKREVWSTTTF
jgi:hypothetical protein